MSGAGDPAAGSADGTVFQFYYTSCETGLAGHQGYQFNAATPGAPAVLVRDVEPLLAYEPPGSMLRAQSPEELAACPVNLCHVPGDVTTIASIEYAGRDYSRRPGNFFAHALAAQTRAGDPIGRVLGPMLPVELWRAPLWRHEQVASTELPPFDRAAERGPLTPAAVGAFLAGHPRRDVLPRLATAVLQALDGKGRPVLIVDQDSDSAARWIAAVCYLLPASLARRISFATYLARPSRSSLHVLGTVPESAADLGRGADEMFALFDFAGDRVAEGPPHEFLRRLYALGLPAAREAWSLVPLLASGAEQTLDDWLPLALAGMVRGTRLDRFELDELCRWLTRAVASAAPSDDVRGALWAVGQGVLNQPQKLLTSAHLEVLVQVARLSGDAEFQAVTAQRRFDAVVDLVAEGRPDAPAASDPGSEAARSRLAAVLRSRLAGADAPQALRLLDWARGSNLAVDPVLLERLARDRIARWLLDTDLHGQEALGRELVAALEHYAELRPPIVEALAAAAAEDPGGVDRVFAGPVRGVLTPDRLRGFPGLDVSYEVGGVTGQPELRFDALVGILRHRGWQLPDSVLLTRLWPEGKWSLAQADHAARYLPLERLAGADQGLVGWLDRPLAAGEVPTPVTDAVVGHYLSLANRLRDTKLLPSESDGRGATVRQTLKLEQRLASAKRYGDVLDVLKEFRETRHPIQWRLLTRRLPERLGRMDLEAQQVDRVLERLGMEFAGPYLDQLGIRLREEARAQDAHIIAGLVMASGPVARRHRRGIEAIVAAAIGVRGKKGREHVAQILRDLNKEYLAADLPMPSAWTKLGLGRTAWAPRSRKGDADQ